MSLKNKQSSLLVAGLAGFLLSPIGHAAEGPSAAMLATACAACHGPAGVSSGPAIPSIAGMTSDYLVLSMEDYKSDTRKATVMNRIAKGYTEDEIKALGKYFSEQKYVSVKQEADASLAQKGKELHAEYCESCHENDGALADGIGVLAGQAMPYLHYSVEDFTSGDRPQERRKKQKMDGLVENAGEDGFKAIIHYYGSL